MRRNLSILASVCTVIWVARGVPVLAAETDSEPTDTIALHFSGRLPNESIDPAYGTWTGQVRSLATGEVMGTLIHDVTCLGVAPLPCPILETTDTFHLKGGTIVSRATASVALDPQHPGFALVGIHPEGNTISYGNGIYAGRTGRARMAARHDSREYPAYLGFDDFWLIELDPSTLASGRGEQALRSSGR